MDWPEMEMSEGGIRLKSETAISQLSYLSSLSQQIDYLISQYGTAKDQVLCDLDSECILFYSVLHAYM